jgi:nucleoid DNA-binding protein
MTYTRNELITELSTNLKVPAEQAKRIAEEFLSCLTRALRRGDKVTFRDFGLFMVKTRKAKIGRNPKQPGKSYHIPERLVVRFKVGKELDQLLNES